MKTPFKQTRFRILPPGLTATSRALCPSVVIFTLLQRHFLFAVDRFVAGVLCVRVSIPVASQLAIESETKTHNIQFCTGWLVGGFYWEDKNWRTFVGDVTWNLHEAY